MPDHRHKTEEDYINAGYEALEHAREQAHDRRLGSDGTIDILNGIFALMVKMDQVIELLLDIRDWKPTLENTVHHREVINDAPTKVEEALKGK